ncbi:MAG: hypothetical protein CML06_19730 [Pseudomonadales bacterium]|nr:hypothetical protein [Pseudomonadales bacterium]
MGVSVRSFGIIPGAAKDPEHIDMIKYCKLELAKPMYSKPLRYASLAAALTLIGSGANAQLLHNLTIGNAKALALGNAVTADPPGIDSIHFNPAGLAQIKGRQFNVKLIAAHLTSDSEFGAPIRPDNNTKQTYFDFNEGRLDQCSAAGATPTQQELDDCWGVDPIANSSSSMDGPGLMLPFFGFTELPILAFPAGGVAFEDPSMGWTFGTAVYSPQGIGYTRDDADPTTGNGSPGAYQGTEVGVTRLTYFSPTVAIPVTDKLSVGVGMNFSYQGLAVDTYIRAPLQTTQWLGSVNDLLPAEAELSIIAPYDNIGRLSMEMEDFLSVGFNFGILYQATDWLSFGFLYQSEATAQMSGDYKMVNSEEFLHTTEDLAPAGPILGVVGGAPFNATRVEKGEVELEYIMPQNVAFGTSIKVLPRLKVNVDLRWVEYSVWDELEFEFSNNVDYLNLSSVIYTLSSGYGLKDNADPDAMRIRRGYDDTWSLAFGAEYQWDDNLVLRVGFEPREGAISDSSADLLFPIGKADLFTAGFGWQLSSTARVDAALGVLYSEQSIDACKSLNANRCQEGDVVYNPYYSMPFETETTAYIGAISFDKKF